MGRARTEREREKSQQFDSWTIKSDRKREYNFVALDCVRIYSKSKTKNNKVFLLFAVSIIGSRSPFASLNTSIFTQYIIKWLGDSTQHTHTHSSKKYATDNYTENWDLLLPIWPLGICWIHKCNKIRSIEQIHSEIIPFRLSFGCAAEAEAAGQQLGKRISDNLPVVYRSRNASPEPKMLCR